MYDIILFDFDGTITDTGKGIINGIRYALERYGIEEKNIDNLKRFIGPPLIESFQEWYGFSHDEAEIAVTVFREYYSAKGVMENELYSGITGLLKELKNRGKTVMIATSKPCRFVDEIIEQHAIREHFDFISSASMDETKNKKADIIRYALEANGITCTDRVLMVGDRLHDINGAKENGLKCVGVLWGYGSKEEFETYGADHIIEKPMELINYI